MNDVEIRKLKVLEDDRGAFFEVLRREHLDKKEFGQIYITTVNPGQVKGNHFHKRKVEWFCIIKGEGELVLKDNKTGEKKIIKVGESNKVVVKIPANISHAVRNTGKNTLILVAYITEPYNEQDPDTYKVEII